MRRFLLTFCILTLLGLTGCAQEPHVPKPPHDPNAFFSSEAFERMLACPAGEIDIASVAITLARTVDPRVNPELCLSRIDRLAEEVRPRIERAKTGEEKVERLGEFIFREKRFPAKKDSYLFGELGLHVFRNPGGNCQPLTLLYLALGDRLDIPFVAVHGCGHVLVYYDGEDSAFYVETASDGKIMRTLEEVSRNAPGKTFRHQDRKQILAGLLFELTSRFHPQKRFGLEMKLLHQALEIYPKLAVAHVQIGTVLHEQGKTDEAIRACRKAIALYPNQDQPYVTLGKFLSAAGKTDEAIEANRMAIERNPTAANAYCNLGVGLQRKGEFNAAVAAYSKALEIQPSFYLVHCHLGSVYHDLGETDKATDACLKAIEINPNHAEAYAGLGMLLLENFETDRAVEVLRKAIRIDPRHAFAHLNLGIALYYKGEWDSSILASQRAIELDPNALKSYHNLAIAHLAKGEYDKAWATVRRLRTRGGTPEPTLLENLKRKSGREE